MNKPLQIYFSEEEIKKIEKLKDVVGEKTKSKTVRKVLNLFFDKILNV